MNARMLIAVVMVMAFLLSCNNAARDAHKPVITVADSVQTTNSLDGPKEHNFDYTNTVLQAPYADTAYKHFSSSESDDRFTFYVPAGNINTTKAIIVITDNRGLVIYSDTFRTTDLISGYELYTIASESAMEAYVLSKAKAVLDSAAFCATADVDFRNSDILNDTIIATTGEVEREHRLLFRVELNEENGSIYGYSRRLRRVVLLFACC